ncbi:MAG TPA: hypothetical protein VIJ46_03350 [Rhabdochlamydiaceae bacterium]
MSTSAVQPNPIITGANATPDVRTCILGGDNAVRNATMAAAAVAIAAVALIFFAEIQTFLWSGLILVAISAGAIALVEMVGSNFRGNPTVDTAHATLDRGVALAETALSSIRSFFAGAMAAVPAGAPGIAAQAATNLGAQVASVTGTANLTTTT